MTLHRQKWITRAEVQANRATLYVFGDNLLRKGYGGQAAAMRGEPNAVGIVTKKAPSMKPSAFFSDADLETVKPLIEAAIDRITAHLKNGGNVTIPEDFFGTNRAKLAIKAPAIMQYIAERFAALAVEALANGSDVTVTMRNEDGSGGTQTIFEG